MNDNDATSFHRWLREEKGLADTTCALYVGMVRSMSRIESEEPWTMYKASTETNRKIAWKLYALWDEIKEYWEPLIEEELVRRDARKRRTGTNSPGHHLLRVRIRKSVWEGLQEVAEQEHQKTGENVTVSDLVRAACYNHLLIYSGMQRLENLPPSFDELELDDDELDDDLDDDDLEGDDSEDDEDPVRIVTNPSI